MASKATNPETQRGGKADAAGDVASARHSEKATAAALVGLSTDQGAQPPVVTDRRRGKSGG